jgi:hypothetical protein
VEQHNVPAGWKSVNRFLRDLLFLYWLGWFHFSACLKAIFPSTRDRLERQSWKSELWTALARNPLSFTVIAFD